MFLIADGLKKKKKDGYISIRSSLFFKINFLIYGIFRRLI